MTIDELIILLKELSKEHGGKIPVKVQSLAHYWPPEPELKTSNTKEKFILLNL